MSAPALRPEPDLFRVPPDVHYLNCAFMSPLPRRVETAGVAAMRGKRCPTDLTPEDFFAGSDRLRSLFARLAGTPDPARVALVPAVSYGAALAARNLELEAGQEVVLAGEQFPSNVYPWRRLARAAGAEVRTVPRPDDGGDGGGIGTTWSDRVLEAIGPDTGLVALPQAHWTDGTLFRLAEIGARAREVGAAFVVDGTQTVGAHPFDLEAVAPDALFCAGYKWLLGPYGLGFAYLGPRFDDGIPLEETWIGREGTEDFAGLVDYTEAYRPDAGRFDVGERSHFILAPMLAAALELLLERGVERVAAHCAALNARIADGARELGYRVPSDEARCSNIVGLGAPAGVEMDDVAEALEAADVHVSRRGDSLRVSPHLHAGEDDADALLEVLEATR